MKRNVHILNYIQLMKSHDFKSRPIANPIIHG